MVIDWRLNQRSATLKPAILIKDSSGKIAKLLRGGDARYSLPVESIIATEPGAVVKAGDIIARISMESAKTRDITGGLPRVAELFEARRPKDHAIIAEITDLRLEMLGTSFIPQHSDARVLEHLIYKWDHSRRIIAKRLAKRYEALANSGYAVTDDQIRDDLARLLHRNAEEFLGVS
jgi:DNA-directed RNA polymerase subunit beta'